MTRENIDTLIKNGNFPEKTTSAELIETHISWVIICDDFVYKIKKPLHYSFLDFFTLDKRKFYCEREIELNRRLTDDIYLDVLPVKYNEEIFIGNSKGKIIDYAVRMKKIDGEKQMNKLLLKNKVSATDIKNLAEKIGRFHHQTEIIHNKNFLDVQEMFNDIISQKDFLRTHLLCNSLIDDAIDASDEFIKKYEPFLKSRLEKGFVRDCHGDLHSRNIFFVPEPQPFDCIEFNDTLRQIDVLNETAFLCMDLDAFGRQDLSDLFLENYNALFPAMQTEEDKMLFVYYKAYRANIRAKVNSLRAKDATSKPERKQALDEIYKYLLLMNGYIEAIKT